MSLGCRAGTLSCARDADPAPPLTTGIARTAQRTMPGALMTGAAAVRRVELHRAPIFAQRALSAPAIAGGAAAEFSEQWRGHGGGPDGRGRHGDGWCNDKQLAPYLSVRAEQDRDCLSARFFLQVLSKVLVLMVSIVYSSVSPTRGGAVWQLVGLITRRSQVQILPPQPKKVKKTNHLTVVGFFASGPPKWCWPHFGPCWLTRDPVRFLLI